MGDVPDFVDEDDADVWEGGGTAYKIEKVVGNGAFGIVWKARAVDTGEVVAIKKVLLDRRYQNRELQMMKVMDHDCVVRLKHYYEKPGRKKDETFLQIVMEYLPDTLRSVTLRYQKKRKRFPIEHIKMYMFQMLKAMEYIHSRRICHRDIKPDNLLVDPTTLRLKLCDFGCSKVLVKGQPNISYICSRYYRAPELLFGATEYSCALDLWSIGTILAELLLGHLPFQGQDSTQQHLVEIMKLLGTPSNHDLQAMGATCTADDLPKLKAFPWDRVFPPGTPSDAIDLVSQLLCYNPETRLNAQQALAHPFLEGVSLVGVIDHAEGSPMRGLGARGAQVIVQQIGAYIEDLAGRTSSFDESLLASLETSLLAGVKAAGVPEKAYAAIVASVRAELKAAAGALEGRKAESVESAYKMQQRVVALAAPDAVAATPAGEMEVDGSERERLQAVVGVLTRQLEESKAAQAKAAEQLRVAQAKLEQLEAERAMGAGTLHGSCSRSTHKTAHVRAARDTADDAAAAAAATAHSDMNEITHTTSILYLLL
ncbi:kinase-like domain-containing protein [Pavlovales sp. CCMP2436]|nr:kinase-like domain-containing protein [Pavlovales sp. CCMP2436]